MLEMMTRVLGIFHEDLDSGLDHRMCCDSLSTVYRGTSVNLLCEGGSARVNKDCTNLCRLRASASEEVTMRVT